MVLVLKLSTWLVGWLLVDSQRTNYSALCTLPTRVTRRAPREGLSPTAPRQERPSGCITGNRVP